MKIVSFNPADLGKVEYVKHPFNRKRLKISDTFESSKNFTCENCGSVGRPKIQSVSPDTENIVSYLTVECKGCSKTIWFVQEKP